MSIIYAFSEIAFNLGYLNLIQVKLAFTRTNRKRGGVGGGGGHFQSLATYGLLLGLSSYNERFVHIERRPMPYC